MAVDKPLVSILMSIYNESPYFLRGAVESILSQSYTNSEIVLISDNPHNDELNKIAAGYAQKDSRIKFIKNKENIGLTKSLNKGINCCNGKYLVRMDGDDISLPTRIEMQVEYMEKHPEVDVASSNVCFIDEEDHELSKSNLPTDNESIKAELLFHSPIIHPAVIIRNEKTSEHSFQYDEHYRYSQDYALWVDMLKDGKRFGNIETCLLKYRLSSNQITSSKRDEQLEYTRKIQQKVWDYFGLQLSGESRELLFKLIYDSKLLTEYKKKIVVEAISDFRMAAKGVLPPKAINDTMRLLSGYYVHYLTASSGIGLCSLMNFWNYCVKTGRIDMSSFLLLIKILLTSRK